jgi:hypothetical protein
LSQITQQGDQEVGHDVALVDLWKKQNNFLIST